MKKEVLFGDDLGRGYAGAIQAGPFIFLSASDGFRDPKTFQIMTTVAGNYDIQCRNTYDQLQAMMTKAGGDPTSIVRIDNFTQSQDWLPQRHDIWVEYFGERTFASTGVSTKMNGINMLTSTIMIPAPEETKEIVVPGTGVVAGVARAGAFLFVSGVRGNRDPYTQEPAPQETPDALKAQMRNTLMHVKNLLEQAGAGLEHVIRYEDYVRDINRASEANQVFKDVHGDPVNATTTTIGCILGMTGEMEVTALAVVPGEKTEVWRGPAGGDFPLAVKAGGFIFCSGHQGHLDKDTGKVVQGLAGDIAGQANNVLDSIAAALGSFGGGLKDIVRLELYIRDIFSEAKFLSVLKQRFGGDVPTLTVVGAEPGGIGEVVATAIAVAPDG